MSSKLSLLCIVLSLLKGSVSNVPVSITGSFYMVNLNEAPYYKLKIDSPSSYAYLYVKLYENNKFIEERKVFAANLQNEIFYATPIKTSNTGVDIKIVVNYYDNSVEDTIIQFKYVSPSMATRTIRSNTRIRGLNPISIDFVGYGSYNSITKNYEHFYFNIPDYIDMNGRYLDFQTANYVVESPYDNIPTTASLRIKHIFENSDLEVVDKYTYININADKEGNTYTLRNDYDYYMDKITGQIFKDETAQTEDEVFPFFIPLSVGYDKEISCQYQLKNVNLNQESYNVTTKIKLNNQLFDESFLDIFNNIFYYKRIDEYLSEVKYNA